MSRAVLGFIPGVLVGGLVVASVAAGVLSNEIPFLATLVPAVLALGATVASYFVGYDRRSRFKRRQVFISYAREDRDKVLVLASAVAAAGYRPWIDLQELGPGDDLQKKLDDAVRNSGAFLAVLPAEQDRTFVNNELAIAAGHARGLSAAEPPILPVLVDEGRKSSVPDWASNTVWLELDNPLWRDELSHYLSKVFDKRYRSRSAGSPRVA